MNALLWTLLVILVIDIVGRLYWLSSGNYPARTPKMTAFDTVANIALLVWICVVLFGK